jgi:hypothetical protein
MLFPGGLFPRKRRQWGRKSPQQLRGRQHRSLRAERRYALGGGGEATSAWQSRCSATTMVSIISIMAGSTASNQTAREAGAGPAVCGHVGCGGNRSPCHTAHRIKRSWRAEPRQQSNGHPPSRHRSSSFQQVPSKQGADFHSTGIADAELMRRSDSKTLRTENACTPISESRPWRAAVFAPPPTHVPRMQVYRSAVAAHPEAASRMPVASPITGTGVTSHASTPWLVHALAPVRRSSHRHPASRTTASRSHASLAGRTACCTPLGSQP